MYYRLSSKLMEKQDDKKEWAIMLTEKVRLLFGFCADLISDTERHSTRHLRGNAPSGASQPRL